MKIRSGFVSNSSSSSFCIYGIEIDVEELREKLLSSEILSEEDKKYLSEIEDTYEIVEMLEYNDMKIENISNIEFHYMGEYNPDSVYIGRSWSLIEDDKTGKEFKEDVENKLKKILGNEVKCYTCQEAWRDG